MDCNNSRLTIGPIPGAPEADREKLNELVGRVNGFLKRVFLGDHVATLYGVSRLGQSFAILVTKVFWYEIRVFVELENFTCRPWADGILDLGHPPALDPIYSSGHATLNGVQEKINQIRWIFDSLPGTRIYKRLGWIDQRCALYAVPQDWMNHPDQYLKRGDVVLTCLCNYAMHAGVYIGGGMVVHYSGSRGARRGELRGDFVSQRGLGLLRHVYFSDGALLLVGFGIRTRGGEEIARIAEERADRQWGRGSYNLLTRNCQHFASDSATGKEFVMYLGPELIAQAHAMTLGTLLRLTNGS